MREEVKTYYGKTLNSSEDLQTNACCSVPEQNSDMQQLLAKIHPEVQSRFYGCGLVVPPALTDCQILDLGCGAGRDVYLLSHQAGERGKVVGVDMTEPQLEVARRYQAYHCQQFAHSKPNTEFYLGYLEQLSDLALGHQRFDLVVSNCVLNLCTDKAAVLRGSYELLKAGGEIYFSDLYSDRRVPEGLQQDPLLYGECLSGALYEQDFVQLAKASGFLDPRRVHTRPLTVDNAELSARLGEIRFSAITYRLIKCAHLEVSAENYGQQIRYMGGLGSGARFQFDESNQFVRDQWLPVSGNTFSLLQCSRYAAYFEFQGDRTEHLGSFQQAGCETQPPSGGTCC